MRITALLLAPILAFAQGFWETREPLPIRATEVASAVLNGKVYTTCGIVEDRRPARLYVYDPVTDKWTEAAPNPIEGGADHCNFAAANGKLYLLGAIRIGSSFVDGNTYEYDPRSNRWQMVARMTTPRGASGVAVLGNRIYVAGGLTPSRSVATFEVFDTETKTWATLSDMPTARDHLTAQGVNGRVYAIGGRAARDFNVNEQYDPGTNTWTARTPLPTARGGLASGVIADRIVVFGGEGNSGTPENTFRQNEEYNPQANTWRSLAPMLTPRHGFYGASLDGRIFAPGGGPSAGAFFSDVNEVFYLAPAERPIIGSLRHAASFEPSLAPGMLVSLFGTSLSQGEAIATRTPLSSRLNATEVKVNGSPVPLIYTGPGQVNFVLPKEIASGAATVSVHNAGAESEITRIEIGETAPGIFSLDQSGAGQGAILIAGTGLIARATRDAFSRAARRGEAVEIYVTGLGRATNISVQIGEAPAVLLFAGDHATFSGLQQINARIAETAATGVRVPVVIRAGEKQSNTVTIAVVD